MSLRILTPRRLDDVTNPDADVFIAFGVGNWPNHAVELLCEIEFTPLCSPSLLNKIGGLSEAAGRAAQPICCISATSRTGRAGWRRPASRTPTRKAASSFPT